MSKPRVMKGRWSVYSLAVLAVALGAPGAASDREPAEPQAHWAFRPLSRVDLPRVKASSWVQTPVDRFILSALEHANLEPAAPELKQRLIRRVTFDLIGLPPTPEETDAFQSDRSP